MYLQCGAHNKIMAPGPDACAGPDAVQYDHGNTVQHAPFPSCLPHRDATRNHQHPMQKLSSWSQSSLSTHVQANCNSTLLYPNTGSKQCCEQKHDAIKGLQSKQPLAVLTSPIVQLQGPHRSQPTGRSSPAAVVAVASQAQH
jgi:hypothetical protein